MNRIFLVVIILFTNLSAQSVDTNNSFTKYNFGFLDGINFNTIPTIGGSLNFEVITALFSKFNLKACVRYSSIYDDNFYEVKGNKNFTIQGVTKISTYLYEVDKIEYSMIPVNIGLEYFIFNGLLSPYITADAGYNFSTSKEQISAYYDGIGGIYDTIEEVPEEYKMPSPEIEDGSSFTAGFGFGLRYNLSSSIKLDFRYIYKYNESIVNSNKFLFGLILL